MSALIGKKDLKIVVGKYFERNNIYLDVKEFIDYWFENDSHLNKNVLNTINRIKVDKKYLVTIQEKYRANYLWEVIDLKQYFDGMLYSGDIGYLKDDTRFYSSINQKLGINLMKDSVSYFDDNPKFVQMANKCGWNSWVFEGDIQDSM